MFKRNTLICTALLACVLLLPSVINGEDSSEETEKQFAIELDPATFQSHLERNNVFVKFFAPWCGHCKRLHPLWEQLAELMNIDDPKVTIAKVDCTKHQTLCAEHEITGYPTLRLFKHGETESVKFRGTRDLPTITDFINQELNSATAAEDSIDAESTIKEEQRGRVVDLNEDSFAKHVSSGNHFVKFFAPWCSHCQRLAPTWETLAQTLREQNAVSISKIDCTQYRPICQDFEVKGYPTLLWIEDGKKIEKYSGGRDHDTLHQYVSKMLGASGAGKSADEAAADKEDEAKSGGSDGDNEAAAAENKLKVLQITGSNFEKSIANGVTFIKFYAPWCGHCQKLSPTWDQLAAKVHAGEADVTIAKVDCTEPENKQICIDQQVEGYPTLFAYKNGVRQDEYDGTRTLAELQQYINKFVGHDEL